VTFTARVIPSIATGRVTFMDGGTTFDTGTLSNGSTTLSTSDLSVGAHTITAVYGGDTNNVASTSSGITQTVNVNGPSSTLISPANNAVLKGTNATITGTATDYSSSVVKNVKIGITPNGGTIKWYTATGATSWKFKWPLPKDGNYTIQSKATDKAGNVESPVYSVSVLVDKTKPTATIIPLASTTLSGTSVTISGTASDAGSGVNNVQIGITPRGSIKTTWYPASGATSWSYTWTLPTDGKYIIKAMATDNGGNTKTTAAVRVTVDNAPPTVSITVPVNNKVLEGTTATISGKASDSGSGVKNVQVGITPSGGTAIWYTASGTTVWSYKWPLPANGSYTIQARASDRADNSELSSQVNVTVSQ